MHQIGSRKRNQPAPPHIVFESLSQPARPTVGDVHAPHLVHWTSLWPTRPDVLAADSFVRLACRPCLVHRQRRRSPLRHHRRSSHRYRLGRSQRSTTLGEPLSTHRQQWSDCELQQDVSAARWVEDGLEVVPTTTVGSLVPTVFDAYAHILYPARPNTHRPVPERPSVPGLISYRPSSKFSSGRPQHRAIAISLSRRAIPPSATFGARHRRRPLPATTTSC